jgi:hypothetical protein
MDLLLKNRYREGLSRLDEANQWTRPVSWLGSFFKYPNSRYCERFLVLSSPRIQGTLPTVLREISRAQLGYMKAWTMDLRLKNRYQESLSRLENRTG